MNKIKILIMSAAMMLATFGASAQSPEFVELYNKAAELVTAKQYADAIPVLEEAIKVGLEAGAESAELVQDAQRLLPTCYFQLGGASVQGGNMEAALGYFVKAAELSELYGDVRTLTRANQWVARVYTAMGADAFNNKDYKTAAEIFSKGYEANPNDTDLALNLAMSYAEDGDYEKGFAVYESIIGLGESNSKYAEAAATAKSKIVYYLLADAATKLSERNFEEGNALLERAIGVDPTSSEAYVMLIQSATNQQNWRRIIEFGDAAANAQTNEDNKSTIYFYLGAA